MARLNAALLAFNRGEVSRDALARVDVAKLQLSAECQLNWEPRVIGKMGMRPGLERIGEMLGDQAGRLIPFVFGKEDTALIELTPGKIRVRVADELVTRPSVATTIGDSAFTGSGAWVTTDTTDGASASMTAGVCTLMCTPLGGLARVKQQVSVALGDHGIEHGIRIVVTNGPVTVRGGSADGLSDLLAQTNLDTGTHALACTPSSDIYLQIESSDARSKTLSSVTIDQPGVLAIDTPWGAGDMPSVRETQSGDIIFTAAYGLSQYKIERRSVHGWSVVAYRSDNGPFRETASVNANFTPDAYYGNGTLLSDRSFFQEGHVGCLFRLFSSGQFYKGILGAANAYSNAVRVSGVGTTARNYTWTVSGTWAGKITLQRSFDGPNSGFSDVSNVTSNGTISSSTGGSGGGPPLDNAIAWERVGFKGGDYTSGSAEVISSYAGGGGFAIVRVTAWNSPTSVDIEIIDAFSSLTATTDWQEQDWSDVAGFPTAVGFIEGRLGWTGRDAMWFSQSNNYTGFAEQDSQGNAIGDSAAILETFGEGPVDRVNWMLSLTRPLFGREMSIAAARSSSFDEPLTPTNFSVKDCATQGAAALPAFKVDKRGVMVAASGRVYELAFEAQQLDYSAHDLTRLNTDIFKPGFLVGAISRQPDTEIYLPRNDGQCAVLLYDPDDDVVAWWRIQTQGTIEGVCVLPLESGYEDRVYFIVKRTINGVTRRFIERMASRDSCVGGAINQLLDCHMVYQGAAVSTLNVPWLPNTTVLVWADGKFIGASVTDSSGNCAMPDGATHTDIVVGLGGGLVKYSGDPINTLTALTDYEGLTAEVFADQQPADRMVRLGTFTVSGGAITLPRNWLASNIVACFGFVAPFMSSKLAYAAQGGSPLTQKKKIDHVGLILYDTHLQGLQYGQRFDVMDAMPLVEDGGTVTAGTVWGEYDEPMMPLGGEWDTDARLCLLGQAPFPAQVGSVVVAVHTNER